MFSPTCGTHAGLTTLGDSPCCSSAMSGAGPNWPGSKAWPNVHQRWSRGARMRAVQASSRKSTSLSASWKESTPKLVCIVQPLRTSLHRLTHPGLARVQTHVPLERRHPVPTNRFLRNVKRQLALAHQGLELDFEAVLRLRTPLAVPCGQRFSGLRGWPPSASGIRWSSSYFVVSEGCRPWSRRSLAFNAFVYEVEGRTVAVQPGT